MKRVLLIVLSVLAFSLSTYAQEFWEQRGGPLGGEILDIEYDPTSGNTFAIIGNNHQPYVSEDNGVTWTALSFSGSNNYFYDIEVAGTTVFLLTSSELYASTDQGVTFPKRTTTSNQFSSGSRIKQITGTNFVLLANSGIYTSANSGATWTFRSSANNVDDNNLFVNSSQQIFILKYNGTYNRPYKSTDGGINFNEASTNIPVGPVYSMAAENAGGKIYAVTQTGLFTSTDGASWATVKGGSISDANISPTFGYLSFIEFTSDGLGMYFIDNLNHKLHAKTVAGAASAWTLKASSFPSGTLSAICAASKDYSVPASSIAFFGSQSGVHVTTSGGASTTESNTGIAELRASKIKADGFNNLFLNAGNTGILESSSGNFGNNWTKESLLPPPVTFLDLNSAGTAIYALSNSNLTLYRSTDKGLTWPSLTTPVSFYWVGTAGADNDKVFGLSGSDEPFKLYYSSNQGTNWTASPVAVTGLPADFYIYDDGGYGEQGNLKFASANRMLLQVRNYTAGDVFEYYKIDFTYTANVITAAVASKITTIPLSNFIDDDFAAVNGKFYFFSDNDDQIAVSSNGGTSWTVHTAPNNGYRMIVTRNGYIFITTGDGKVHISRDDGASFEETLLPSSAYVYDINDIEIDKSGYAYLAFDGDYVYRSSKIVTTPAAPSTLISTGKSATAIGLKWNDNNVSVTFDYKFIVERSTNGVNYSKIGEIEDLCYSPSAQGFFTDQNVLAGTSYFYRVYATNDAGSSTPTTPLSITTLSSCAQSIPDNRSWTAVNANESGLGVATPKTVGVVSLGNGRYRISDIALGLAGISSDYSEIFYESCGQTFVSGSNNDNDLKPNGNGTWNGTNILTLKWRQCGANETETITLTLNANDPAPSIPANVQALALTNSSVEVSWTSGFYDKFYIVERSSVSAVAGFAQIGSNVAYPTVKLIDNAVVEGTTYYYRVKARNGNGTPLESGYSAVKSLVFKKPNFVVSSTAITDFTAPTIGAFWADFNNDGREDFFTSTFDGASDSSNPVIFENLGTGNFIQHIITIEDKAYYFGSAFAIDYDNDGKADIGYSIDPDASEPFVYDFYRGNGDFTFTKATSTQLGDIATEIANTVFGSSWADINNDGLLDLLTYSSDNGHFQLFKQETNHSFTKISGGDLVNDNDNAITAIWSDYDNDGYSDLLIISPAAPSRLYKNNGDETFSLAPGVALDANASNAAWGDYNNDGNIDLYLGATSMNVLYTNNGNGTFTEFTPLSFEASAGSFATATWGDYNNDGFLDLLSSGFGSNTRLFFRDASNPSSLIFTKVITEKINDTQAIHLGATQFDYDNDGLLDIAMGHFAFEESNDLPAPLNNNLYKNNNTPGNWIKIKLVALGGKSAVGAKIAIVAGGKIHAREIAVTSSFVSQNSSIAHIGLGSSTSITSINVKWPSGIVQNLTNITSNQLLTINEDNTGPALTTLAPANGAISVNANTTLSITLNEASTAVAAKTLKVFRTSDLVNAVASLNVTSAAVVGNTFTFTLPQNLLPSTSYSVSVDAGAVTDIYGNPSLAIAPASWQFTTTSGPVVSTVTPLNSSVNVNANTTLALTFNVSVTPIASKTINLYRTTDLTTPVNSQVVTTGVVSGNTITFTLPQYLLPSTSYSVSVDAGAFSDANGNITANSISWQFTTASGPVVSLLSPANNATGVALDAKMEITFDKPPVAVAGKKVSIFRGTTLVQEFASTAGTIAGNKVSFTPSAPAESFVTYFVSVESGAFTDTFGNSFTGVLPANWTFITIDNSPPVFTAFTPPATVDKGFSSTTISFTVTDNSGAATSVVMSHRKIAGGAFTDLAGTKAGNVWSFAVQETTLDANGVEFFFTAKDPANNTSRLPTTAGTNFYTYVNYKGTANALPSDKVGFGGDKTNWKIFTIPFVLTAPNNGVTNIFDELNPVINDKTKWRLITYKSATSWGEFPGDFSTFTRGTGYFINIKDVVSVTLPDASAPANTRANLFKMDLKTGWNQIGNPYLTPISWADVAAYNNLTGTAAILKKFTGSGYANGTALDPFEGGFVFVNADINGVSIPFSGQTTPGGRMALVSSDLAQENWNVKFKLQQQDLTNEFGGIGMNQQAAMGMDDFDDLNPPRFFDYTEINFAHPEHFVKNFAHDVVRTQKEYTWTFNVDSNVAGPAELNWDNTSFGDNNKELFLFDVTSQVVIDMRSENTYSFTPSASRQFRVYYGENLKDKVSPDFIALGQPYPNPASSKTTVPFRLPGKDISYTVSLEVYDMLGKKVATLAEGNYKSGFYNVIWNTEESELANGLYTVKFVVGGKSNTVLNKKVMLKK